MTDLQTVTPETYERVKLWESQGKKVFEFGCVNLGCLRHFFTTDNTPRLCPACGSLVAKNQFSEKNSSMFRPEEFIPEKITRQDLDICIDGHGRILLNIRQHWRPIKLGYMPTGDEWEDMYHQMRYGNIVAVEDVEPVAQSIQNDTYIDENWEMLKAICKDFGYELVEDKHDKKTTG